MSTSPQAESTSCASQPISGRRNTQVAEASARRDDADCLISRASAQAG